MVGKRNGLERGKLEQRSAGEIEALQGGARCGVKEDSTRQ
jgi:hypothetical protein